MMDVADYDEHGRMRLSTQQHQCPGMRSSIGTQATKNLILFLNHNFDLRPDLVHFTGGSEDKRCQN